jgi:polysaccharide biosynthesis protein PslJ
VVFAAVNLAGIATTVSRGALLAVGIATALLVTVSLLRRSQRIPIQRRIAIALVLVAGLAIVSQAPALQQRTGSAEASSSSLARVQLVDLGLDVAERYDWLGAGPGMASTAARELNTLGLLIENGYIQLLISIGVPGLVLFVLFTASGVGRAAIAGSYSGMAPLVIYLICVGLFNILESNMPALLLLGLASLMAWRSDPQVGAETVASP